MTAGADAVTPTEEELTVRLNVAEAAVTQLAQENGKLRQQLGNWHRAGARVAARETRLGEMLTEARLRGGDSASGKGGPAAVFAQLFADTNKQAEGARSDLEIVTERANLQVRSYIVMMTEFGLTLFVAIVAYQMRHALVDWFQPSLVDRGRRKVLRVAMEKSCVVTTGGTWASDIGLAVCVVEVSELQVLNLGSIAILGDVYLKICVGVGESARTTLLRPRLGAEYLSFKEMFNVTIGKLDDPVSISVFDKDEDESMDEVVAKAQVPATELVGKACQVTEYYRIPLQTEPKRFVQGDNRPPVLALRLRTVLAD